MRLALSSSRGLAAAAMLAALACSDSTATSQNVTVVSTFTGFSAVQQANDMSSPSAGTAAGTIQLQGTMALPSTCYTLSSRAEASGQFIVFYAIAERTPGSCAAQVQQVSYSALISGASSGTHTVVVRHETDDATSSQIVDVVSLNVVVR